MVEYKSQDEANSRFRLLAHLAIMRNPFSDKKYSDTMVVVLNGVSGPGTFALAEVLTGGVTQEKAERAEQLLSKINEKWSKCEHRSKPGAIYGIEAVLEVEIKPSDVLINPDTLEITRAVEEKFYDKREVVEFNWIDSDLCDIRGGNPRQIGV
jgi:hypothetical protein